MGWNDDAIKEPQLMESWMGRLLRSVPHGMYDKRQQQQLDASRP